MSHGAGRRPTSSFPQKRESRKRRDRLDSRFCGNDGDVGQVADCNHDSY